jgi:hypothetical protein
VNKTKKSSKKLGLAREVLRKITVVKLDGVAGGALCMYTCCGPGGQTSATTTR